MSKIDDLIKQYCPNGVEYKELGDILDYEQPTRYIVKSARYDSNADTPVLTAGQTFILGYTFEKDDIYKASKENPVIIFDDFTTSYHWVDFNFKVKSSAMKMLRPKPDFDGIFKYVLYAMGEIHYSPQDHARQWISQYSKFKIPVPPLPVQEEIVKVLDAFTALEAELEAELEARKRQYEYYRNKLLTFDENTTGGGRIKFMQLGEACKTICAGGDLPTNFIKTKRVSTEYPYPIYSNGTGESALYGYSDTYRINEDAVSISARGTIGYHTIRKANFTPIVRLIILIPDKQHITTKYLNYVLDVTNITSSGGKIGGGIPQLTVPNVRKIVIPVPPIEEQERIVAILDKFDSLVNDISEGLPAELTARRQQYEYYRNKLLTFEEAA